MQGKADHDAAATEAYEEAGVEGKISSRAFGQFGYDKISDKGKARRLTVTVYALQVQKELADWPERAERQRRWVNADKAAELAGEPELVPVLRAFAKRPPPHGLWYWISRLFQRS